MGWQEYLINYPELAESLSSIEDLENHYQNFGKNENREFDKKIKDIDIDKFKNDNELDELSNFDALKYYLYFTKNIKNKIELYYVGRRNLLITFTNESSLLDIPKDLVISTDINDYDIWVLDV